MSKTAARVKETAKINQNLRNQNTIKRATERAETIKYRNANRPRPMSGPVAKRVEFESKALQKRQARIEKLDKTTARRMNTPSIKGRIQSKVETRQNSKAVKAIRNRDKSNESPSGRWTKHSFTVCMGFQRLEPPDQQITLKALSQLALECPTWVEVCVLPKAIRVLGQKHKALITASDTLGQ